jgi:hypothetical protein
MGIWAKIEMISTNTLGGYWRSTMDQGEAVPTTMRLFSAGIRDPTADAYRYPAFDSQVSYQETSHTQGETRTLWMSKMMTILRHPDM